jgi:cysteine synthase
MGNYRFHYHVTGGTIVELAEVLKAQGIGTGKISAYCSAMGSAGTIAAGDRLKQVWHDHGIVGLEPIQCSTLYNNGYDRRFSSLSVGLMSKIFSIRDCISCGKKNYNFLRGSEAYKRRLGGRPRTLLRCEVTIK